jgi:RimJ/RimL family protein N-acetyltransferase
MKHIPMSVVIEPLAFHHIDSFHRALDCVARERKYLAFLEAPPLDNTRRFVLDNIAQGHPQFVAVADESVVGWCDVIPQQQPVHRHCGVLGMGLLLPFRGKGHGTSLLEMTLNDARCQKLARIELRVHADNAVAISLYKKFGFKTEGVLQDAVRIDGIYKNMIIMAIVNRKL